VAEGLDWIEPGRFAGRVEAEEHADRPGEDADLRSLKMSNSRVFIP